MAKNDEKKEYLRKYRYSKRKIGNIERDLEEIRNSKYYPSSSSDGMPSGSGTNTADISNYIVKVEQYEERLRNERYENLVQKINIQETIDKVSDNREKEVLEMRYIQNMSWKEISNNLHISERQIFRIHGNALNHLKLEVENEK